jgi:hypothetical protein
VEVRLTVQTPALAQRDKDAATAYADLVADVRRFLADALVAQNPMLGRAMVRDLQQVQTIEIAAKLSPEVAEMSLTTADLGDLPLRARRILGTLKVRTRGDLCDLNLDDVLRCRGVGIKTITHIAQLQQRWTAPLTGLILSLAGGSCAPANS